MMMAGLSGSSFPQSSLELEPSMQRMSAQRPENGNFSLVNRPQPVLALADASADNYVVTELKPASHPPQAEGQDLSNRQIEFLVQIFTRIWESYPHLGMVQAIDLSFLHLQTLKYHQHSLSPSLGGGAPPINTLVTPTDQEVFVAGRPRRQGFIITDNDPQRRMTAQSPQTHDNTITVNDDPLPTHGSAIRTRVQSQQVQRRQPRLHKPVMRTLRLLPTSEKEIAMWDSLALTQPTFLQLVAARFSWSRTDVIHVLQYFEQISMVKGQERIRRVIQQSRTAKVKGNLDSIDPFSRFERRIVPTRIRDGRYNALQYKTGVPEQGYLLPDTPDQTRTWIEDFKAPNKLFTQTHDWSYQIHGFPNSWEPLPIGTTIMQIIQRYPNHIWHAFLDGFLQHRIGPKTIWKIMQETKINVFRPADRSNNADTGTLEPIKTMAELFQAVGISSAGQDENFLTKRLIRRMDVLGEKYSVEVMREYLQGDNFCVVRELGDGLKKGSSKHSDVDRWLDRKRRGDDALENRQLGHGFRPEPVAARARPGAPRLWGELRPVAVADKSEHDSTTDDETIVVVEPEETRGIIEPYDSRAGKSDIESSSAAANASLPRTPPIGARAPGSTLSSTTTIAEGIAGAEMRTDLHSLWTENELKSIIDRASHATDRMLDDLLILMQHDSYYADFSPSQLHKTAVQILQHLISRHYTRHHDYATWVRIDLTTAEDLAKTVRTQLEVEVVRLSARMMPGSGDDIGRRELANQIKLAVRMLLSELYITTGFVICRVILGMLKKEPDINTNTLMKPRIYQEARVWAQHTMHAIKASFTHTISPRDRVHFGADLATLLASNAEQKIAVQGLDDWRWLQEMLIVVAAQQGGLHESLKEKLVLQNLSDDKHGAILDALRQEMRKLRPITKRKVAVEQEAEARNGDPDGHEAELGREESGVGQGSDPPAKKVKVDDAAVKLTMSDRVKLRERRRAS